MKTDDKNRKGTALVVVLIFTLMSTILSAALLTTTSSQALVAGGQLNLEKALYVAEAGVERAADYVGSQYGYLPNVYTANGSVGEGDFTYTLEKIGWRAYKLSSVGTVSGQSVEVKIDRLYLPTYAKYALWMHTNGQIYFIPGEEFFGHVHSNDKLWFYSNPVDGGPEFWKELTSAWASYGGVNDWAEFHMGFELEATEGQIADVNFNNGAFSLSGLATSFGLVLEGDTTITFQDDDMLITNSRKGWTNHSMPIGEDQLIYVKDSTSGSDSTKPGKIRLNGGTVDGRMTIVSDDDILINNHINYALDPAVYPDADNALGLISKDDIWVTQSAPNNLNLDAAMIAAGQKGSGNRGSFGVINYNTGAPRGPLNVYGSIVQDQRGAVGTFNDDGIVSGYYKNYSFDSRFESAAPPYYPVIAEKVEYEGWSEGPPSS